MLETRLTCKLLVSLLALYVERQRQEEVFSDIMGNLIMGNMQSMKSKITLYLYYLI